MANLVPDHVAENEKATYRSVHTSILVHLPSSLATLACDYTDPILVRMAYEMEYWKHIYDEKSRKLKMQKEQIEHMTNAIITNMELVKCTGFSTDLHKYRLVTKKMRPSMSKHAIHMFFVNVLGEQGMMDKWESYCYNLSEEKVELQCSRKRKQIDFWEG